MSPTTLATVLIVDDHHDTAIALSRVLRDRGYNVTTTGSYREATELCSSQKFSVLVTESALSDGDGLELLAVLRAQWGEQVRGLVLSSFFNPNFLRCVYQAGFDDCLMKPVRPEQIEAAIQRCAAFVPTSEGVNTSYSGKR